MFMRCSSSNFIFDALCFCDKSKSYFPDLDPERMFPMFFLKISQFSGLLKNPRSVLIGRLYEA